MSQSLPTRSTLDWAELRALAQDGVTLAPHTRTHPLLTRVTSTQVREEIAASRDELARETGQCAPAFAYPAGAYDATVQKILREEGFQLAFTTAAGHNPLPCSDALQLRAYQHHSTNVSRTDADPSDCAGRELSIAGGTARRSGTFTIQ